MSSHPARVSSIKFELVTFPDDQSLAGAVADRWLQDVRTSGDPRYSVALSGGRITRRFLACVTDICRKQSLALDRVHFFWGDERCVPPTDRESNFAVAQAQLFLPLAIQADRIHRIRGEINENISASEAEAEICGTVPLNADRQPVLDMVFLGMGEDGHVASLFPNEPDTSLSNPSVYRPVVATKPPPVRITLGYRVIAAARQVWVLASGPNKEAALQESLSPEGKTPLARVIRLRARTVIFTDIRLPDSLLKNSLAAN